MEYRKTYVALAQWKLTAPLDCPSDAANGTGNGQQMQVVNCTLSSLEKVNTTQPALWYPATSPASTSVPVQPNTTPIVQSPAENSTCLARSFAYPGWTIENYSRDDWGNMMLNVRQSSTDYPVNCHMGSLDQDFSCDGDADWARYGMSEKPETQLHWDGSSHELSVGQTWICAEGLAGSPS